MRTDSADLRPATRGPQSGDRPFEAVLARSGHTVSVPADQGLGEVLLDAGIDCSVVCGEGYCGSCAVQLLEGDVDHRDTYLTPDEQASGRMTICVSRAKGNRVVIDL